jgi:hypothetical protein
VFPKDQRTLSSLSAAIAKNVLFSHLSLEDRQLIAEVPSTAP